MKIAIFTDCYLDLTGGIKSSIDAQKEALEKDGHEVFIFSTGFHRKSEELKKLANRSIFQVPSCKLLFLGLTPVSRRPKVIERWLKRIFPELRDFDVFYVHYEAGCSIAGLRLGKQLNIPTVQVMHGREDEGESSIIPFGFRSIVAFVLNWLHSRYIPHEIIVPKDNHLAHSYAKAKMWTLMVNHANYADLVLTPSEHFKAKLSHYGVKKEIKVFPNGISDSVFPKNPTVKKFSSGQTLKMIWHSRVSAEKRIMPFLEALDNMNGRYRLDVYGGGGEYARAKRFADKHRLNVIFHGDTDFGTIIKRIPKAHLDILASYNFDNYPMTLVEAEACGVPAFICDPDMKEIIPDGSYVLSASESPEAMAIALDDLFKYPEKIQQMSEIMLKHREETLISNRIKILENIFNDIIKK